MRPYWIALSVAGLSWACSSDPSGAPPLVGGRAGAAGVAVGASSGTSGGGQGGAVSPERACEAGKAKGCQCSDGLTHSQRCAEDGSGYLACECPVDPPPMGGAAGASGAAGEAGEAGEAGQGGTASGAAGAGGQADAGAAGQAGAPPATCEVIGSTGCNCQSLRSPTARGQKTCPPGASEPICDCSMAEVVPDDVRIEPCGDAHGPDVGFRGACLADTEFPECRVHYSGSDWIASSCATPLGGPSSMVDNAGAEHPVFCCKPAKAKPPPVCVLPEKLECLSYTNARTSTGLRGAWVCIPGAASPRCVAATSQPIPSPKEAIPCADASDFSPPGFAEACAGDTDFPLCTVVAPDSWWARESCVLPKTGPTPVKSAGASGWQALCCLPAAP